VEGIKNMISFYKPFDKIIVKSKDCYLYDSEGKKYIDFEAGVWCANIGHSNQQMVKRMNRQIKESIHHGYHFRNKHAEELSLKLQQLIGFSNGASVFLSSGSEAVNLSITLAKFFTGRKKILKIDISYLSAFGYGQIADENILSINLKKNDLSSVDNIDFKNIAAFVIETGGASLGVVRFPDYEFIKKLIEICKQNDCLIIAEEVTTGMGRLGKWFGFQYYDFMPDMVVAGKALGNGYPVSSVTINSALTCKFEQSPFRYAQSHQNDPLGCSVALEVINIIESNNLVDKSGTTGEYFRKQLDLIRTRHPEKVKEIRGRGLMLAAEFNEQIDGELISKQLFDFGFVVGFKFNTLRFLPPLTIKYADIDKMVGKLDELLKVYHVP
jgi:acetylornithine/N-succinyldiaminopimelate aminotransferase